MSWIFPIIIWSLMFVVLHIDNLEIKIALTIVQFIVFIIQIIYAIFKG